MQTEAQKRAKKKYMDKTYRIIIKNNAGCEIYNRLHNASNENNALLELLKESDVIIYGGDTITIELY